MIAGLFLAFLSGFIALSYEILWYRAFSFTSGSRADTFGLLLGAYLTGLALGALAVRRYCRNGDREGRAQLLGSLATLNLAANLFGFFVVPALAWTVSKGLPWEYGLVMVGLAAAGLGSVFPLLAHVWIEPDERAGKHVSYVYLANILGSTLGSFLMGFVLTDHLSLSALHFVLCALGLVTTVLLAVSGPRPGRTPAVVTVVVVAVLAVAFGRVPFTHVYEKLQEKLNYSGDRPFKHVVETRSGVLTVNQYDQVFGGGAYDGAFNTSLQNDKNSILRCYALAGLRPEPKDVLMIGLGSGSWAAVVASNPAVERLTVVEINAGYLQVIPRYPSVAGLLTNPKVTIVIDDGRRWLNRNGDRKFDMIVANATLHWRSNATNLLSAEFLGLVRSRLKPGGLYYYNATTSVRVLRTGCTVFPHALKIGSFLAVSDSPLDLDFDRVGPLLYEYPRDGGTALDRNNPDDVALMGRVVRSLRNITRTREWILKNSPDRALVTDDNMGMEWDRAPEYLE